MGAVNAALPTLTLAVALAVTFALTARCATPGELARSGGSTVVIEWLHKSDADHPPVRHAVIPPEVPEPDEPTAPEVDEPVADDDLEADGVAADDDAGDPPLAEPFADVDPDALAAMAPGAGVLRDLHPGVRERALRLYALARDAGIELRFIHGYAPYRPRKRRGPGGMATWHNFGLAFDVNLAQRTSMADAKAHFDADRAIWATVGELAEGLGLVWGGGWRSTYDPFHFEWHPCPDGSPSYRPRRGEPRPIGCSAVITREDLAVFLKLAGKRGKNYRRVWTLYESAPRAASP